MLTYVFLALVATLIVLFIRAAMKEEPGTFVIDGRRAVYLYDDTGQRPIGFKFDDGSVRHF